MYSFKNKRGGVYEQRATEYQQLKGGAMNASKSGAADIRAPSNTTTAFDTIHTTWNNTNQTISVCLYLNAERIKLLEWLAYHYTTLPFGKLIVGIDPNSPHASEIQDILLKQWHGKIDATVWLNDTYSKIYKPNEGWPRLAAGDPEMFLREAKPADRHMVMYVRNQRAFAVSCIKDHWENKRGWVWVADTDEYVMPNYVGKDEMDDRYDGYHPRQYSDNATAILARIDNVRSYMIPIRKSLPAYSEQVTIADLITQMPRKPFPQNPHCHRFPDLKISGYESQSNSSSLFRIPDSSQQYLTTLRQRWYAPKTGEMSKAIMNINYHKPRKNNSDIPFHTVHRPHTRLCSSHSSGADYRSSWLRVNHYRTGTLEAMLEQGKVDFRAVQGPVGLFQERNFVPINESNDIVGWVEWFVEKVGGMDEANRLLFDPLEKLYAKIDTSNFTDLLESLKHIPRPIATTPSLETR